MEFLKNNLSNEITFLIDEKVLALVAEKWYNSCRKYACSA